MTGGNAATGSAILVISNGLLGLRDGLGPVLAFVEKISVNGWGKSVAARRNTSVVAPVYFQEDSGFSLSLVSSHVAFQGS